MHFIQEANLKPFRSLYTHNSNYIQRESRREGSVILEKSSQGTTSTWVENALKRGIQPKNGKKWIDRKDNQGCTRSYRSGLSKGSRGRGAGAGGGRGEERRGEKGSTLTYFLLSVKKRVWSWAMACLQKRMGNRQPALWPFRTAKRGSSKLDCTCQRKAAIEHGLPLSFLGPPQPGGTTRLLFHKAQPTNINYLFLDLGVID